MNLFKIWTDGAMDKNPGSIGGWSFLIKCPDGFEIIKSKAVRIKDVTNSVVEILAVYEALDCVVNCLNGELKHRLWNEESEVVIVSDSMYVVNCGNRIYQRKKHQGRWADIDKLVNKINRVEDEEGFMGQPRVKFEWVKGHAGNVENEMVDKAARAEVLKLKSNGKTTYITIPKCSPHTIA